MLDLVLSGSPLPTRPSNRGLRLTRNGMLSFVRWFAFAFDDLKTLMIFVVGFLIIGWGAFNGPSVVELAVGVAAVLLAGIKIRWDWRRAEQGDRRFLN